MAFDPLKQSASGFGMAPILAFTPRFVYPSSSLASRNEGTHLCQLASSIEYPEKCQDKAQTIRCCPYSLPHLLSQSMELGKSPWVSDSIMDRLCKSCLFDWSISHQSAVVGSVHYYRETKILRRFITILSQCLSELWNFQIWLCASVFCQLPCDIEQHHRSSTWAINQASCDRIGKRCPFSMEISYHSR